MFNAIKEIGRGFGPLGEIRQQVRFLIGFGLLVVFGGWLALKYNWLFVVFPLGWTTLAVSALRQHHLTEHYLAVTAQKQKQRLLKKVNGE